MKRFSFLLLLLLCLANGALAQNTITVNSKADDEDDTDGECTLREAIIAANRNTASGTATGECAAGGTGGTDVIEFDIVGSSPFIISPASSLPGISDRVQINGASQPGNANVCTRAISNRPNYLVIIDGSSGGGGRAFALSDGSDGSRIRGLNIRNFENIGIAVNNTDDHTFECNFIGTNQSGTTGQGGTTGISINDGENIAIGGTSASAGNLIADHSNGVRIIGGGSNILIQGNYIGTDKGGTDELGNTNGLNISNSASTITIGGTESGARNIISGNANGVVIDSSTDILIQGNYIGTDKDGTDELDNNRGIRIRSGSSITIGGTASGAGNIVALNNQDGIIIQDGSTGITVSGNSIFKNAGVGLDLDEDGATVNDNNDSDTGTNNLQNYPAISSFIPNSGQITVTYSVDTAPANAAYPLTLEFFLADADGQEGETYLGSLTYNENAAQTPVTEVFTPAVTVRNGDLIVATATDADGNTSEFAPAVAAVTLSGCLEVTTTADTGFGSLRQAITCANSFEGSSSILFRLSGTGPHVITPETALPAITDTLRISGTTQSGNAAVCNTAIPDRPDYQVILDGGGGNFDGLRLRAGSDGSTIKGLNIRGFGGSGIEIRESGNHAITCNFIGTDETGTAVVSNGQGIVLTNGATGSNQIGASNAGGGNLISGHNATSTTSVGIYIDSASSTGNRIIGNTIGPDKTGTVALQNGRGIWIVDAPGTVIGGIADGAGNLISGNRDDGIFLSTSGTTVRGNLIGTDSSGTAALGNAEAGISILGSDNEIGGAASGAGNIIAFNGAGGIEVADSESYTGNAVWGNSLFGNGGLGLDLNRDGATANDADDSDTGANKLQNTPVVTAAEVSGSSLQVTYSVDTAPTNATYPLRIEFFRADSDDEEGQTYLGFVNHAESAAQTSVTRTITPAATLSAGDVIMATATDDDGNTSEFSTSNATVVNNNVDLAVSVTESADPVMAGGGTGNLVYTVTVTNNGPSDASGVELENTLTLPSGVTVDSATPSAGTFAEPTWTLGTLASGASEALTLTLTVDASAASGTDVIDNTATITALDQVDTDSANDSASEATSIQRAVDLAVSVAESTDPVMAGSGAGNLVYTVTVTNNGPSDASGVELENTLILPSGVTVDSITPSQGTFADPTWTLGTLASGASETLTLTLTVDASTPAGTDVISNAATITAVGETDTDTANDSASEATSVSVASGTMRYVATTGSDTGNTCLLQTSPCATLAYALEQANAGDTIALDAGSYAEAGLLIDKALTLQGVGVIIE